MTQRSGKHFIRRCLFDIRVGSAVLSPTHCNANLVNSSGIKLSCLYVSPSLYFVLYEILYDWVIINLHILCLRLDYTTPLVKCENNVYKL